MTSLKLSINRLLNSELEQHAEVYTRQLREAAAKAGWPVIASSQIKIGVSGDSYVVQYPDSIKEEIELLEFGDSNKGPSPVLRNFMRNLEAGN